MSKQQKKFARLILFSFIFGVGVVIGHASANFSFTSVIIMLFATIGLMVLAVLTYAAVTDDSAEQEETHSYPSPEGFDKKFEN